MKIEINRLLGAVLPHKDTLKDLDAGSYPELAALKHSPVPAPTPRLRRWEAPRSPRSPLDALVAPRLAKSFKRVSSCSDLESLDSPPDSPRPSTFESRPSSASSTVSSISTRSSGSSVSGMSRAQSIATIEQGAFEERMLPSGLQRALTDAQADAFEAAWARRRAGFRLPDGLEAVETWELRSSAGQAYFITATPLAQGTNAEFGLAVDGQGRRYGVRKVHLPGDTSAATVPLSSAEVHQELRAVERYAPSMQVVDTLRVEGSVYQIMPLMAGDVRLLMDVEQRVFSGRLRDALMRRVGIQLCDALEHIHGQGAVHGDQKPSNALWDGTGKVVLSDVGGVAHVDASGYVPEKHLPTTTPAYLSPELTGQDIPALYRADTHGTEYVDAGLVPFHQAADVWSLGFTLLEWHMGVKGTPLEAMQDPATSLIALEALYAYTQQPHAEAAEGNPWARYFSESAHKAPQLTRFVLECMLDFDPATRASVSEVKSFLRSEQLRCGDDAGEVGRAFKTLAQRAASHNRRRLHLASVLARRDAVMGESAPKAT